MLRHWHIEASKSSISAEADNPNCDDMRLVRLLTLFSTVVFFLLQEGAYTFNGSGSQRSETDVEIQSSELRCLRECALVDEVVKLLDTGEGTIRRIFALTKHFDDLFFHSVGLLLAGRQT